MSIKTIFYSALLLGAIYLLFTAGFPILLAFVLAFLLEPIIKKLSKWTRVKQSYISIIVCTIFTILLSVLAYYIVVFVTNEVLSLINTLVTVIRDSSSSWQDIITKYHNIFSNMPIEYQDTIYKVLNSVSSSLQSFLVSSANFTLSLATRLPNTLVDIVIFFIAIFLFSSRLPTLRPGFLSLFHPDSQENVNHVLDKMSKAIFGFLRAQIIIFLAMFLIVFLGFAILGIKYASALALLGAIVDILPILGIGAVLIPMSIYMFISGNYFLGVGLLIQYIVTIAARRVIENKVLSDRIGINPLATLVSMYLGFQLAGLAGLFMGPLTVLLFQTMAKVGIIKIHIDFKSGK